jgi:hypothetical protein
MSDFGLKVTHGESNDDRSPPKPEALTPRFVVTILVAKRGVSHRVEQVHLQNRLKGELTDNVAKIWCCSQW